ncbi:MAG: serine/threonine protein kinase [Chloroflexi bacterium]|nr:serine/threonine protein kinase [Chloroflexota bacterium]
MKSELLLHDHLLDGRFAIRKNLESGGMALVFMACDTRDDSQVVVKLCTDEKHKKGFQEEIKLLGKLHHPAIQRLIAHGSYLGMPYYVMPFISSTNLRQYLDDQYRMPEEDILHFFTQITTAVAYLHHRHIVHNDLKPQNMLVKADGMLILSDFGLSRSIRHFQSRNVHQKTIWGSPVYLAPELPEGRAPSYAADVYALGIILFLLYLGYPPFFHNDLDTLIAMHQKQAPPSPQQLNPAIDPVMEGIILRALEKDPHMRFRDAAEMGRTVQEYQKSQQREIAERIIRRHPDMLAYDQETRPLTVGEKSAGL